MPPHPQTIAEWIRLARAYGAAAETLLAQKQSNIAWANAGFAVECALKGAVMAHQRYNRWPSREREPDLYTHDLMYLLRMASIDLKAMNREPIAPMLRVVLAWKRSDGYDPTPMPIKVASDMVQSMREVLQWINTRFRMDI